MHGDRTHVVMSVYNETLHPRGQAENAGQFRAKSNTAPGGVLSSTTPAVERLDELYSAFTTAHAEAREAEQAAWFAYALEEYSDGDDRLGFGFEADDYGGGESWHSVFVADGQVDDDRITDAIPMGFGSGDGVVTRESGVYRTELTDADGQSLTLTANLGDVDAGTARDRAQEATDRRATMRDAAEMVAIARALERLWEVTDADEATFTPTDANGIRALRHEDSGLLIGAGDETEAAAFAFRGRGVQSVHVARDTGGTVTITRTVIAPISGTVEDLTDVVDGEPRRWSTGSL